MVKTSSPKIFKQIRLLLTNRWSVLCFALLTLQQIIEASATVWLIVMMKSLIAGEPFFLFLFLYLGSLAIPYLPGCLAMIIKIYWKQESQKLFINTFVSANRNQISEWSNKGGKEEKLSVLTAEGPAALHALIDYLYDLYGYVLSVFFNIFVLSVIIEPLFAAAYCLSVLTVVFVIKSKRKIQRKLTKKALSARISLYQSLLAAWDNVLLGNFYSYKLWAEKTTVKVNDCLEKNIELERFDQILAIAISLYTSIPCLCVVIYYAYVNRYNIPNLTAFLVTLPVLFTILSYTYQTLSLIFRWAMHKGKMVSIYRAIQPRQYSSRMMENKVKWPKIQLVETKLSTITPTDHLSLVAPLFISSHQELLNHTVKPGRITLRGENGAGKSTALMLVKNSLADKAFFLPTQSQLSFVSETNKLSTGESLRSRLVEILERVDSDVLLLDEWDANLDNENQERLSLLIDQLAEKKCVIEVRHR